MTTPRASLSVAIITKNEEANLARTLESVRWANEIVVVDSGSTDATQSIAASHGARFLSEPWRGFAAQKNYALTQCSSDWVLSLDADEEVSPALAASIRNMLASPAAQTAYLIKRRNHFLGRWMRHGGYYPDAKLRLFPRGAAHFAETPVHETAEFTGSTRTLEGSLIHHAYPTLHEYLEHMERYSTLGAERAVARGKTGRGLTGFLGGVVVNPVATFFYNYGLRLGLLDGREGLLLHLYHSVYVSWKYAKAWERSRQKR